MGKSRYIRGDMPSRTLLAIFAALLLSSTVAAQTPADAGEQADTDASDGGTEPAQGGSDFWGDVDEFLSGNWLDPPGAFWAPRRGPRWEVAGFIGPEAAFGDIAPTSFSFPSFGGVVVSGVGRYYPVDHVALLVGTKLYLGINQPAAGTGAETVLSPLIGVRYDLVKENRLSLLVDVMSGPSGFFFAGPGVPNVNDVQDVLFAFAVGAEVLGALAARYTLGPTTFELRSVLGGRAGSAQEIGQPSGNAGPFSALYAGVDFGFTFSFFADDPPVMKTTAQ